MVLASHFLLHHFEGTGTQGLRAWMRGVEFNNHRAPESRASWLPCHGEQQRCDTAQGVNHTSNIGDSVEPFVSPLKTGRGLQ